MDELDRIITDAMNTVTYEQLLPHERTMVQNIASTASYLGITDDELQRSMPRITRYLDQHITEVKKRA